MITAQKENNRAAPYNREAAAEVRYERWAQCNVNWTAVSVGALASLSMVLIFGLIGVALGAQLFGSEHRLVEMRKLGIWTLIFSVCGAFFSAVVGGWVVARIAGIRHSEPAIIHGAIAWLVTVPILVMAAVLGAGSLLGGWYGGLAQNSATIEKTPFVHPETLGASATTEEIANYRTQLAEYDRNVKQWNNDTPAVVRVGALGALIAMLLALVGSVIGAWMATGEPMNFSHHRTRKPLYHTL